MTPTPLRDHYLLAADAAVRLLADPAVAARWDEPSALAEFSVRGLAGHLAQQVFHAGNLLAAPAEPGELSTLDDHYAAARWVSAIDTPDNVLIRERGEQLAADGPVVLVEQATAALTELRIALPAAGADRVVLLPWTGRRLRLDDFLLTRVLELTIHSDDLAVSVDVPTPELPDDSYGPVLALLTRMSVRRYGALALLRALSRRERAPQTIAAL